MAGIYWLVSLLVIAGAVAYARTWYYRPSGMPEMLTASLSYETLEYMDWYARRHKGEDWEECDIPTSLIASHIRGRQLSWRQRNDIIRYMKRMVWVYEDTEAGTKNYAISRVGKQELETAGGLGLAVEEAAQIFNIEAISGDQAKATAAAIVAAALRVHARTASSENRNLEELAAKDIEGAARTRDPDKIDRAISRASGVVAIVSGVAPYMVNILRLLGWLP